MGEAAGREEAISGEPFRGAAGSLLNRVLHLNSIPREALRIGNILSCFPGTTLVAADRVEAAYRRWYTGTLITARTREGFLSGTPNHPVRTVRGWIALGDLQKGDYLLRGSSSERVSSSDPNVHHGPTSFAELFQTLTDLWGRRGVVGRNVDFHGDGGDGEVDVVVAHGFLWDGIKAIRAKKTLQFSLEAANSEAGSSPGLGLGESAFTNSGRGAPYSTHRVVGGLDVMPPLSESHSSPAKVECLALRAELHACGQEGLTSSGPPDSHASSQCLQGLPCSVASDEVVSIEARRFTGHVYNLQTSSQEYIAEGYVVHNCQPPNNFLDNAPWEYEAIAHCKRAYRDESVEQWLAAGDPSKKVMVALGAVPLRNLLGLSKHGVRVQDFHGSVLRDPTDRFWIVPTYHPSFIQRGAFNLIGVMSYDLQIASEVAAQGFPTPRDTYFTEPVDLVLDPTPEWFAAWAANYLRAVSVDPEAVWLAVDIETPDKAKKTDEGELTVTKDRSFEITRINFSCSTSEGLTVPWSGPYLDTIRKLLSSVGPKIFWNAPYDVPRLKYHHYVINGQILDFMWGWHVLQSDVPRGLGFVAPFYSSFGPWKHLSDSDPVRYAAIDGVQTLRIAHGVIADLAAAGMDHVFWRHVVDLDQWALHPAEEVGLPVDQAELHLLEDRLDAHHTRLHAKIQKVVPEELKPLTPKQGLMDHPGEECSSEACKQPVPHQHRIYERSVAVIARACSSCGATQVVAKHRCKDPDGKPSKTLQPAVALSELQVVKYYRQQEFNPGSSPQILELIRHFRLKPGKDKKSKKPSANKECIERLSKSTKGDLQTFFESVLDIRSVDKINSTYVKGSFIKLRTDPRSILDGRLHPTFLHKPSTLRLSCQSPNLQNVVADRVGSSEGRENLAAGFRNCIVATPGNVLVEADFSGIEAVLTGWFCGDPQYIRLAKLGVHAFLASHLVGEPADLSWSDDDLKGYLKEIKGRFDYEYNQCKRTVHGTNYGLTERGMVMQFPKEFPTMKVAQRIREIYQTIAPKLFAWQTSVRERAHRQGYLGGPGDHPFSYKHWFWNVITYKPVTGVAPKGTMVTRMQGRNYAIILGEDSKRCVAFYPQSTAAGVIAEVCLRLFNPQHEHFIGDTFNGRTPLLAVIHDSLLLEVPEAYVDYVVERVVYEMMRPIPELPLQPEWGMGEYLSIGVEVKKGLNWANYQDKPEKGHLNLNGMRGMTLPWMEGLAGDRVIPVDTYDEELDDDIVAEAEAAS